MHSLTELLSAGAIFTGKIMAYLTKPNASHRKSIFKLLVMKSKRHQNKVGYCHSPGASKNRK